MRLVAHSKCSSLLHTVFVSIKNVLTSLFPPLHYPLQLLQSLISQQSTRAGGRGIGVSFEDFLQIIVSCQGDSYDMHEEIIKGFSLMDKDKDGYITLKDLRTLCNELNLVLQEEELDDMIFHADMEGDGKVSKEEFVQMMLKTSLYAEHV